MATYMKVKPLCLCFVYASLATSEQHSSSSAQRFVPAKKIVNRNASPQSLATEMCGGGGEDQLHQKLGVPECCALDKYLYHSFFEKNNLFLRHSQLLEA